MDVTLKNVTYWEARAAPSFLSSVLQRPDHKVAVPELRKILLNDASIRFSPGSVTALYGYGSGSIALMNILKTQQKVVGHMSGSILYDHSIRSVGAYCDIACVSKLPLAAFFDLSVHDFLFWAAKLRINVSSTECSNRAQEAIRLTGLESSTRLRMLSAGHSCLLSIAAELVGNPTLLLLDDPLSGLDEISALQVIAVIGRIARRQYASTTVVFSCQQSGHCLLRHVSRLAIFGGNKLIFSQDISALSLSPTMKLSDCNDYDRAELDLRDIEIELSSLLNTIALNLNGSEDETSFGNGSDTALQLLSTYCSELKMNLASYGVKEVVKNDEEEDGDELTISLHGDSPTEPSALTGGNIDDQSKMVAPFMRQLQATGGLTPSQQRVAQGGGMKRRRTLKQGFGGGFARAPKSTLEELSVLIKRSKQNQMKNGWKLFFPLFTWLLSAIIIGLVAPNIGEEDAVGTIYTPDASSGESLDVEYFSVSSATFVVSITPLLLLAFNVPYLHLQHVRLKEETSIGLVNQVSVWLSVYIGDLPMYILFTILYAGITYGMVGFQGSLGSFVTLLISVTLCFYSLSVCCAALAENVVVAGLYYIRVCALCMLFAGYYETIPNLSTFWTFFTYISPSRWAFESSMLLMYADAENAGEYLDLYAFDDGKVGIGITWLCVWFGSLSILSLMLMSPITAKVSRKLKKQPENCKNFKTPQKLQPSWNRLQTGTYSHIESNINPLTSDETLSPQSPSPLLEGESEEKSILSFPEICDGGRVSTDISKSFAGSVRYSDRLDKCSGRIPIAATTGISADAQMTLSFRQVTYTNRETEDSSQGEDSGLLFANSVPFIFNSYSNSEKKATREPSHPVIDSRQVLLEGITGEAKPGKITAIIDGSGEGSERILLRVLAGHADMTGQVKGNISINGQPVPQGVQHAGVTFIPSRDPVTVGCLTVREVVRFSALLRRVDQSSLPCILYKTKRLVKSKAELGILSKSDRLIGKSGDVDERVDDVIRLMGLSAVADCIIGERCGSVIGAPALSNGIAVEMGPLHGGISGAQMRCLSIAVGLVNKPSLVFLENPLYGLDRHSSMIVCDVLRGLAAGNRTLVCSVLSPPPLHVFDLFDDMLLLGRGMLIYAGPSNDAVGHFDNIGFQLKEGQSTVDFLLDIVNEHATLKAFGDKKGALLSLEDLADLRKTMIGVAKTDIVETTYPELETLHAEEKKSLNINSNSVVGSVPPSFELIPLDPIAMGPAARVMAHRRLLIVYRSRQVVAKSFIRSFLVGCVLGSIFYSLEDGNITSRITLFTLVYLYLAVFVSEVLPGAHRRQNDFLRERSVGSSVSLAYWLSDGAPSFAASLIQCFLLAIPLYPLAGLRSGFGYFIFFLAIVMTAAQCCMGLMYICSALCPTSGKSIGLYLGLLLPIQYLFSGSLIYADDMSYWLKWIPYINPMHMFLSGLAYNEFSGNSEATGHNSDFDYIKNQYNFNTLRAPALARILFVAILYRLVWLLLLKLREIASQKRRLRRAMGAARRRARKLVTAGLRWRKGRQGYSDERPSLLQGVGLVSVDNDDYVMINSTHASRQPVFSPKLTQIDEHQKRTYSLNRTSETLSTDASLASARFSTYFQDDYTKSPHRSKDHALSSDGRIKSRIVSVEDDNLRV